MTPSPIWHPFTQHALEPSMRRIAGAEGAWLEAADGQRIFDGVSSWWVITHGHRHPKIIAAIRDQAATLDQIIFAGFTHEPAEAVAAGLMKIVPAGLAHVFFSDSGSTSVEVALKMALGYWRNIGSPRTRILALEHAYHGDTIGTMSAGARGVFNTAYEPLLFEVGRIPFPKSRPRAADIRRSRNRLPQRRRRCIHLRADDPRRRRHADVRCGHAQRNASDLQGTRRSLYCGRSDDVLRPDGNAYSRASRPGSHRTSFARQKA